MAGEVHVTGRERHRQKFLSQMADSSSAAYPENIVFVGYNKPNLTDQWDRKRLDKRVMGVSGVATPPG